MRAFLILSFLVGTSVYASSYDIVVMRDRPSLFLKLSAPSGQTTERDPRNLQRGTYKPNGNLTKTTMPNGDIATVFNGSSQYLEVPSSPNLSVKANGALSIEAWIRPDVLNFPNDESDRYVHWAGKGEPGNHEYALRIYSKNNSANRPNRISGYVFNLDGGLGSGSYFQDAIQVGKWIYVVVVINRRPSTNAPTGTISIYKNAVLRKTTPLNQFDVEPEAGDAPLRIGTRDLNSFFKGAIAKFAVYSYPLSTERQQAHYSRMSYFDSF